jgi:hypothetical protein
VASFLEKVDREVAARVEARLSGISHAPAKRKGHSSVVKRRMLRDALAASGGALVVAAVIGLHGAALQHGGPPPVFSRGPAVTVIPPGGNPLHVFRRDAAGRGIILVPAAVIPSPGRH